MLPMRFLLSATALILSTGVLAQVPKDQLAKPPADAVRMIISSAAGPHGESWMWTDRDGKRMGRESLNLRGQVWEMDSSEIDPAAGLPTSLTVRGVTPQGNAAETFSIRGSAASWKSPVDAGDATMSGSSRFYISQGGPVALFASFVEHLLAAPNRTLDLLPGGKAQAEQLLALDVGEGVRKKSVVAWKITGLNNTPTAVWTDTNGRFFGLIGFLNWLPDGYQDQRTRLDEAEKKALAAQLPALSRSLVSTPGAPVAFTNVQTYDADNQRFLIDQTVVVSGGKIVQAGPSGTVKPPAGAQVVEGKGKTLIPGLWDAHMHMGGDYAGFQELSMGVTSVRDPGNDDRQTIDRRERAARGDLLMPNVYASSLIDGKGPYTAQVANVATSEEEAIALVRKTREKGFIGVKFYGTFDPKWLPAAIAEAHRLGLHVHGHIPAGMRTTAAIEAGYDEVTHINWIMMEAMPDSVLPVSNGIMRFEGPGRYARDVDLDGPALNGIVSAMARGKIYSDPTMVAFEGLYVPENGDMGAAYGPFVGTLPVSVERSFRSGGFAVPRDLTRADYRASWARMVALLKKMHDAGVPIVAGTDGSGIELVRELEIYVESGLTPAQALSTATIVPARLVGADKMTGSIAVGKTADLVLIEGDPSKSISALRQTRLVMMGGRIMDADKLREAAGFSGRPR